MLAMAGSFTALAIFYYLLMFPSSSALSETDYKAGILIYENDTDRLSLLAFKAEISHDPLGILSSWNDSTHFCKWPGVACGRRHQRVTVLSINSSELAGSLSPQIGNLSFLTRLELQNNRFSGSIPQELGHLLHLRRLMLANNTFSGGIPVNLSRCSNLQDLYLGGNRLTGMIPDALSFLSKLEEIDISRNSISGPLPSSLGNLSLLTKFSAPYNSLSGVIPGSFGKTSKLKDFSLGANNLTGLIPSSLYNVTSLTTLSVDYNKLEGSLPPELGLLLRNVEFFGVAGNNLKGKLPVTIFNASKLSVLSLGSNEFSGQIPPLIGLKNLRLALFDHNNLGYGGDGDLDFLAGFANSSNLETLEVEYNKLGGFLPEYISNFSRRLQRLDFGGNGIWGSIPAEIGNLIGLNILSLHSNQLTGAIPKSICKLKMLVSVYLPFNELSGNIPSCLGNLTSLLTIYLYSNNLEGEIPTTLGNLRGVLELAFSQNKLNRTLPREIMSISSLTKLYASDNQLTGSIPFEIGKLVSVGFLDLSNNRLSGEIPGTLGGCTSVESLLLYGNLLEGTIPQSLSSLRAIQNIDLSRNNLSGKIPDFLGDINLLYLNLSFNNFEGAVPVKGTFRNASAVFLSGNHKLCGGSSELHLPHCLAKRSRQKHSLLLKLILPIVLGTFVLITIFYLIILRSLKKAKSKSSELQQLPGFLQVSYATLLKATGGFSSDNLIGQGSFGSVYKAILETDIRANIMNEPSRQTVAVKVFNLERVGASKSFIAECESLRNIRHRNLVKIVTACSSTDFQGNDFKALVYEFMENGSLERWLHPTQLTHEEEEETRSFDLLQRLSVSIDAACALDYLHNQCETPIVHCDLKPSNILLDGQMIVHLGDFGLAKLLHTTEPKQSSSIGLRGTIGYAPPEYGMGGEISTNGDIYSYGIVLLEMFTGKRPTDNMFREGLNLRDFVEAALSDGVIKVVDPVFLQEQEYQEANGGDRLVQCLASVLKIGLKCSNEVPSDRMSIINVISQLTSINGKFLRAGTYA